MALVRQDENGLYLIAGGVTARPGAVNGFGHAYRMDDGGLEQGDKVKARHKPGSSFVKITLPDGRVTRWFGEGRSRDRDLIEVDPNAVWDDKGLRDFSAEQASESINNNEPRAIDAVPFSSIKSIFQSGSEEE